MKPLSYAALEGLELLRPVRRLDFLAQQVHGKRVFDLGALDETAVDAKRDSGQWLHARLCSSAASVVGIDNSAALPEEGLTTDNGGRIIRGDIFDLSPVIARYGVPDVIVAGELIEHLPDTTLFLRSLAENTDLKGVELIFSTPNACCWHNWFVGIAGRESMHKDHLQVYSYKTLRTLFARAEIDLVALVPCRASFYEMIDSASPMGRLTVTAFQAVINTLEFATPALSAGWIGVARL